MRSSLRLGFAGTPEFAVPALERLARSAHTVQAVFTQPDRPAGRGRTVHPSPVKQRALELGLTVHQPASFKTPEALEALRALAAGRAGRGRLRPDLAAGGARRSQARLLQHPCLAVAALARRRAHPARAAGRRRDHRRHHHAHGGGARHRPDAGHARDRDQRRATRLEACTIRLAVLGGELICETLDALAAGRVQEVPQPQSGVTYAAKISKAEALIDWQEDAVQVLRRVRAFNPSPVAETRLDGAQLRIWEAEPHAAPMPGRRQSAPRREPCCTRRPRGHRCRVRPRQCCASRACSSPAARR